jgi:aminoglycoside phosphotransferase (APT) family kinase protein
LRLEAANVSVADRANVFGADRAADATAPGDAMGLPASEAESLRQALLRTGLIDDDERPAFAPLTGGVSSLIVLAETRRGKLCVKRALERLKVAAEWKAPLERNGAEVNWMRTVAGILPEAVPKILGHDTAYGAFAMAYLPPDEYPVWKALLSRGEAEVPTATLVAGRLATIHSATASSPEIAAQFDNAASFRALRLDPYFGEAARRHPRCAQSLHALIRATESNRIALVHGDVSPKNLLVGPHGPVFLDAECANYGDPAFDLAFCLNHLLLKQVWVPSAGARLRACFDAMVAEYLARLDWEPVAAFEARAAALLPGLLLARVDGKSPVEYLVDERDRECVRRFAQPFVIDPPKRLSELASAWDECLERSVRIDA